MEGDVISKISKVTHFKLPMVSNNIPFSLHPECKSISRKIDEWFLQQLSVRNESSRRKIIESKVGLYACMMHPNAQSDKLFLAGKHLWSVFLLDDLLESSEAEDISQLNSTILKLATATPGCKEIGVIENKPLLLYAQVMQELRAAMDSSLLDRYVQCIATSLDAVKDQVFYRAEKRVPGVKEYKLARRATGSMEALGGIMTEFCTGIRLSQADIGSPSFRELIDRVADHVVLVNDLLSFRKEFYEGTVHHNWISVLLQNGCDDTTFQNAIDQLCEMIHAEELAILALQKEILRAEHSNSELNKFASEFLKVASGSLVWSFITGRYHGYGNTLLTGKIFSGTWLLHPDATIVLS